MRVLIWTLLSGAKGDDPCRVQSRLFISYENLFWRNELHWITFIFQEVLRGGPPTSVFLAVQVFCVFMHFSFWKFVRMSEMEPPTPALSRKLGSNKMERVFWQLLTFSEILNLFGELAHFLSIRSALVRGISLSSLLKRPFRRPLQRRKRMHKKGGKTPSCSLKFEIVSKYS